MLLFAFVFEKSRGLDLAIVSFPPPFASLSEQRREKMFSQRAGLFVCACVQLNVYPLFAQVKP